MIKTLLPDVTVVCVTTKDYGPSIIAIKKTLDQITPFETIYFSDIQYRDEQIRWEPIAPFKSVEDYNHFIFKRLGDYIKSSHVLVIQWDGFVLNGSQWKDEFLNYDYIGAPWTYTDGRNVGNGGFSLRSMKLQQVLQFEEFEYTSPEDEKICRYYRQTLEKKYGIKYAPESVAHQFSFEMHPPKGPTFGFHNHFHTPWRESVILKRSGAIGDVIMMEPVMEYFYKKGKRVIIDTPAEYYNLFNHHSYPIEHLSFLQHPPAGGREYNLDMAYEITPKQLALKSYYERCGITDGELRNAKLLFNHPTDSDLKLFDKYVILHVDDTEMAHRNIHGVDWEEVAKYIEVFCGYPVFRVGNGNGVGGLKINTVNLQILGYVVGNANYFIGLDSGISHIAIANQVSSMVFFGSVNPKYRHADLSNIKVMQKHCPANVDSCYHDIVGSVVGQPCEVDAALPPCISWKTAEVISEIKKWIK
jgi:hypothetical protein